MSGSEAKGLADRGLHAHATAGEPERRSLGYLRTPPPIPPALDLTERPVSSRVVYDGALLHVHRDEVALPDGSPGVREWIRHPGAAAAVPLFADGTVLLIRQYRYGPRRTFEEVPAGKLDVPGEAPEAAARRELREETGYDARRWTPLGPTFPAIGYSDEVIHLFLAEDLESVDSEADADEFVEPFRIPLAEACDRARRGLVPDAKTCVALLLAEAHVNARG